MKLPDTSEASAGKLRKKLFFYLATALLALVFGMMATISFILFDHLKKAESHSLAHIAEIRSMALSEWCRRAKDIAKQITSRTRIRQELEKYNKGEITLQALERFTQPKLQDAMNLSSEVLGILRLDINNQIVTDCGTSLPLTGQKMSDYVSDRVTVSQPIANNNCAIIIVSAPILNRAGERQGTDLVMIDCKNLKRIITAPKNLGKTSEIIAAYRSHGSVWPLFHGGSSGDNPQQLPDGFQRVRKYLDKAIAGTSGLVDSADIAVAYYPIQEADWGLVITQNVKELYTTLYRKMGIIGGLSVLIYFVILFGFWFIMKPLAGRILLHTDELEKRIQQKTEILEKEIIDRKKAEKEKEEIIVELREAMEKIKILSGLLPICASCKKIRDDKGYWNQIESFIQAHSEAVFSHGICPECAKKLYPNLNINKGC